MKHEVHDEVGLEIGRRVAPRLREQSALLDVARENLARRLRQNANAPALVRCYQEGQTILNSPLDEIWSMKAAVRDRHAKDAA